MTQDAPPRDSWTVFNAARRWSQARLWRYLASPRFWLATGMSVVITALAGPYDTLAAMGLAMRLVYWAAVLLPAFLIQFYVSMWLREYARQTGRPWGLAALLAGLIGAVPILGWVLILNSTVAAAHATSTTLDLAEYTVTLVVLATLAVNAFMPTLQPLWGFGRAAPRARPVAAPSQEPSPLFDRLQPDLGRDVVCIRADNHHLDVTTTRGNARVLMRLADAEADLATLPGVRVHRSWWVNLSHVVNTDARPGGLELVLSTGHRVPVSRAQRARVDEVLNRDAAV